MNDGTFNVLMAASMNNFNHFDPFDLSIQVDKTEKKKR